MGHSSQQINVSAHVAIWYAIAAIALGAKPLSEKVSRFAYFRLLQDVWEIGRADYTPTTEDPAATRALRRKTHQTIRKVTQDLEEFSFNTAVAAIMELRRE